MFFKFVLIKRHSMNKESNFVLKYCLRAKDTTKETGDAYSNVVFLFPVAQLFIGFLIQFFPLLILSSKFQNKGKQQSNLFPVSAGNDLRMSTMRPNPYLSTGVEMRKSKKRGFFQLFSRPN
jgi:hypothetical protein